MISGIGARPQLASSTGTSAAAQTEQSLFATIDTNADGSISKTELSGFLNNVASASGTSAPTSSTSASLMAAMDSNGDDSISLQEFESNARSLVSELRSQLAGSAVPATDTDTDSSTTAAKPAHHHHHGGGPADSRDSLVSQLLQQYQSSAQISSVAATGAAVSATA